MLNNENARISIIIPTFKEVKNIPGLLARISSVAYKRAIEVLLIDDNSNDGTIELINNLQSTYPWVKLIVRNKTPNLCASIWEGLNLAQHEILITMDADLSHPPEKIPELVKVLLEENADVVIGSRYVPGGGTDTKWPLHRLITSRFAALLGRLFVNATDPLSGFIAIRRETIQSAKNIKLLSWKIGLEIMVKCNCKKVREVPILFSERKFGESKLNFREVKNYLWHVMDLAIYKLRS